MTDAPTKAETQETVKAEIRVIVEAFIPSETDPGRGDLIRSNPMAFTVMSGKGFKIPAGLFSSLRKLITEMAEFCKTHTPKPQETIITPDKTLVDIDGNPLN